jgi:hypothetical protein
MRAFTVERELNALAAIYPANARVNKKEKRVSNTPN